VACSRGPHSRSKGLRLVLRSVKERARRGATRSGNADYPRSVMPMAETFVSHLEWSGAARGPTRDAATFSRDLNVTVDAIVLPMSAAPSFRGDPSRVNPEQLFVASLSACQALTYLFLAARNQIAIVQYSDDAQGWLELVDGKMRMSRVVLRPHIYLATASDQEKARRLIEQAHSNCFIANSVAATVAIEPEIEFADTAVAS
jgi:organic hydroperoxide reductase OsmC/OhrA